MEVRAEILGERIAVKSDRRFVGDTEMSKAVPGGRWNKEDRYWHYPLTLASCRILRATYTDMLVVGPRLSAWARREINKAEYMEEFAKQKDSDLVRIPAVAPAIDAAMSSRTYQRVGARFLGYNRNVLIADEPTLGKTIQYLGGLVEGDNERGVHLIIAPKSSLYTTWAEEVHKWTDWHAFWMPDGRPKRERMLEMFLEDEHPSKFVIVNPEMLQTLINHYCKKCDKWEQTRDQKKKNPHGYWPIEHFTDDHKTKPMIQKQDWPLLFDIEWNSICIDEAHLSLLGNRGAKKTQTAEGLTRLRMAERGMKIASTGTPLKGHAINFWATFNWLDPVGHSSKWAWAESFLEVTKGTFGSTIGDVRPDREQALYESLRSILLRRIKKEVQPDLPDDLYQDHWVTMPEKHAKQYNELVLAGETEIEGGALSTNGILAEYTRQKQFSFGCWVQAGGKMRPDAANSPKLEVLLMLLAKRGVTGNPETDFRLEGGGFKYMVASQFTTVVDFLCEELEARGIKTHRITGAITSQRRNEIVRDWQQNSASNVTRVLIVNTKAGGTSLTLDAMCDEQFILDETWTRDDQVQVEGRIKNRDVEKRVATRTFHYIRTRSTIEEEIAESGLTQDEFQKTLLDRSRGMVIKKRSIEK